MNLRTYLSFIAMALMSTGASAQQLEAKDTITDNNIIYPSSFDTDVKALQDNWYLQRYTVLDSVAKRKTSTKATDAVYVDRLQRLPNIIEMPFNSIVKSYIEMYATKRQRLVEKMLGMSLYYMPIFEEALERYQLPNELKYLPVIESALDPNAVSKAGACGLWQIMPATATGEGLEMNSLVDMRRDPFASSEAAAHLLSTYFSMYHDWTLVIAAYNCGPGNVNKAIKRANSQDYWVIYPYLPAETRGYVPAFIAANYIMNYYAEHDISHALARRPIVTDTVHVSNRVHLEQIAEVMGLPIDEIRVLNPQYRKDIIPGHMHPYPLTLPSVQAYCYIACEDSILRHNPEKYFGRELAEPYTGTSTAYSGNGSQYVEQLVVKEHTVKKGETLKSIAKEYGVTAESIRRTNQLASTRVKTGTILKINTYDKVKVPLQEAMAQNGMAADGTPLKGADNTAIDEGLAHVAQHNVSAQAPSKTSDSAPAKSSEPAFTTYTVKSGDTLSKIASRHGVTVQQIQNASGLKTTNIRIGQKLKIPNKRASASKSTSKSKSSAKSKKSSKKRR